MIVSSHAYDEVTLNDKIVQISLMETMLSVSANVKAEKSLPVLLFFSSGFPVYTINTVLVLTIL